MLGFGVMAEISAGEDQAEVSCTEGSRGGRRRGVGDEGGVWR